MAVRNEHYEWTTSAMTLDGKLREKLKPIIEKAIEDGMELEDAYYIASMCINHILLSIVLDKKSKRRQTKG